MDSSSRETSVAARCKTLLAERDDSHGWFHVERVVKNAKAIARELELGERDSGVVILAAVLHDLEDHKYAHAEGVTRTILADASCSDADAADVLYIIEHMSFSTELDEGGVGVGVGENPTRNLLLSIVQDADRLDAIGAVGIARCFTYGGSKRRVLYDPAVAPRLSLTGGAYRASSVAEGAQGSGGPTTINHFHEKLLKLSGMMKTGPGRRIAAGRHAFMESYLEQFGAEVEGER